MPKAPNNIVAAMLAAAGVLALTLHSIYEDLLKSAVLKFFGARMGMSEAELMSRLTEMALPLLAAVAIIWGVYRYLKSKMSKEMNDALRPRIEIEDAIDVTVELDRDGHFAGEYSFLSVHNPGNSILEKCLIKIEAVTGQDEKRENLQVALTTEARRRDGHIGRFSLGPGERKRIPLTNRDGRFLETVGTVFLCADDGNVVLRRGNVYQIELIAIAEIGQSMTRTLNVTVDSNIHVSAEWAD